MESLYFPKKFLYFLFDPWFYANVQKFRLLDYVLLLHAKILSMTLKGLISICSEENLSLVGKAYTRKADACNHKKIISQQYTFNFLKSSTVLLFALIPVNKDLE